MFNKHIKLMTGISQINLFFSNKVFVVPISKSTYFFRWKGSIYKLLWPNLMVYIMLYSTLSFAYRFLLNEKERTYDSSVIIIIIVFIIIILFLK